MGGRPVLLFGHHAPDLGPAEHLEVLGCLGDDRRSGLDGGQHGGHRLLGCTNGRVGPVDFVLQRPAAFRDSAELVLDRLELHEWSLGVGPEPGS
jgi:hypothetical protein